MSEFQLYMKFSNVKTGEIDGNNMGREGKKGGLARRFWVNLCEMAIKTAA